MLNTALGVAAMLLGLLLLAAAGWMLAGGVGMAGIVAACVAAFLRWPEPCGKALAVVGILAVECAARLVPMLLLVLGLLIWFA